MTLKDELPRSVAAQYATAEKWRNNSRKNEEAEPKRKQCPVLNKSVWEPNTVMWHIEAKNARTENKTKIENGKIEPFPFF